MVGVGGWGSVGVWECGSVGVWECGSVLYPREDGAYRKMRWCWRRFCCSYLVEGGVGIEI